MPTASVKLLSRRHARIFYEQGDIYLVDLGSRNGTRLNGQQLAGQPQRLMHGDEILFGNLAYHLLQDTECTDKTTSLQPMLKLNSSKSPPCMTFPGPLFPSSRWQRHRFSALFCRVRPIRSLINCATSHKWRKQLIMKLKRPIIHRNLAPERVHL
jgi:hypothetical protein